MNRGIVLFSLVFSLYVFTLAPTYLWSDSAKLAIYVHEKVFTSPGLGAHSGHAVLGYLFSLLPLPPAYSQNLMSALFGALTALLLYRLLCLHVDHKIAFLCSLAFSVSHLFWLYSVINETYSLLTFFIVLILYLCFKSLEKPRRLYIIVLVLSFAYTNHASIVLIIPGCLILLWQPVIYRFVTGRNGLLLPVFAVIGTAHVFLIPLLQGINIFSSATDDVSGVLNVFWQGPAQMMSQIPRYPFYLLYQFPTLGVPLGIWGALILFKIHRRYALATFAIWIVYVLFATQYFLQRLFPLLIPSFLIFSIWIAFGISELTSRFKTEKRPWLPVTLFVVLCVLPPGIYYASYRIAESKKVGLEFVRRLPYRNNYRYYLFPPKHDEWGARRFVEDAFKQADSDAIILADFNPAMALQYAQKVLNQRPDINIQLMDFWINSYTDPAREILIHIRGNIAAGKSVYLADNWEPYYFVSSLSHEFALTQNGGPLWKVTPVSQ